MIFDRHAEHLGGDDARHGLGQSAITSMRPLAFTLLSNSFTISRICDRRSSTLWGVKATEAQVPDTAMRRGVQKEHLFHHDLGDGVKRPQTDRCQLLARRRSLCRKIA